MRFTPRLEIFPDRIEHNARSIVTLCHEHGISVAGVTKVTRAHPVVVHALVNAGVDMLADSRLENLQAIRALNVALPLMLLRIPAQDRINEVVEFSDISLNSSVETIKLLSQASQSLGKKHQVILMVDLGDLREGIWPDALPTVIDQIIHLPGIKLIGLGCNLACYGGVIPTAAKMEQLIDLCTQTRSRTGLELPVVSGGNSANLPLIVNGAMPSGITNLRVGEAIQLGRNVLDRSPWTGTRQDTYRIVAQVIELENKPSMPIGLRGQDAFGGTPDFIDLGWRKRAICNIGRQDIVVDNLTPEEKGIEVLGGSSDHLILDVEDSAQELQVGSEVTFFPGYGALLAAATSAYVQKVVIEG
jgi:predicted amino acid racemase